MAYDTISVNVCLFERCMEVFEARLDGALSSLLWWKVSLPTAEGLEPDDL